MIIDVGRRAGSTGLVSVMLGQVSSLSESESESYEAVVVCNWW